MKWINTNIIIIKKIIKNQLIKIILIIKFTRMYLIGVVFNKRDNKNKICNYYDFPLHSILN